jgi:hypothetical protein
MRSLRTSTANVSGSSPRASPREVAGYGTDVDLDVIRAWRSLRSLGAARWLIEHGYTPPRPAASSPCSEPSREGSDQSRATIGDGRQPTAGLAFAITGHPSR